MTLQEAFDKISHSTPISTALTLALCGGAYWTGTVATRVSSLEERASEEKVTRDKLTDISAELKEISRNNQLRIQYLERQVGFDK
jgi:hypothetical protein